jgi:hypothetical protein
LSLSCPAFFFFWLHRPSVCDGFHTAWLSEALCVCWTLLELTTENLILPQVPQRLLQEVSANSPTILPPLGTNHPQTPRPAYRGQRLPNFMSHCSSSLTLLQPHCFVILAHAGAFLPQDLCTCHVSSLNCLPLHLSVAVLGLKLRTYTLSYSTTPFW